MIGRFLAFGITACIPFVLVRFLTQEEFGTYKQAFLISSTLYWISQLGLATSLFYFLPESKAGGRYVCNTIIFLSVMSVVCVGTLGLARKPIALWLKNPGLSAYLPSIGLYTAFLMISVILEIVMICRRRYVHASATYALSDALRALCFVIPVLLGWGLQGLFIGAAIATGSRVVAMFWYFKREFGNTLRADGAILKSQLQYALPFGGALLVEIIQRNYHQYFISSHFDPATFAIYAAGCLTIPFIDFVATPSSDVMMVKMREAHANGNNRAVLALWHDTTGKLALLFFPLVVFSIIVSRELIITLYTKTYEASVPVFAFWSLAIVFTAVMVDGVLRVYAQTRFLLINNLIKLGLTAVLLLWFVRSFQLVGAVLATLLTTLVGRVLGLWRMKHVMGIRWREVLPWNRMGVITLFSIAAGVPAILVKSGFQATPKIALVVTCITYGLAYWGLALSFRLVSLPDFNPVWTAVRKLRTRLPLSKADTTVA